MVISSQWSIDTSSCKEYKKLLELICRNEEKLKATLIDEQKELFEKYTDCVREYQTITDCLIFQNSFKLDARVMLEVMEEKLTEQELDCLYRQPSSAISMKSYICALN